MPDTKQKTWLDAFLSTLEDTFQKDRESGRPVKSMADFKDVVRRSAAAANEADRNSMTNTVRSHHGKYLVALPNGQLRADSNNSTGEWEAFETLETGEDTVVFKCHHGTYLSAQLDGSLTADYADAPGECQTFELEPSREGCVNIKSCHGKYLVAMPDGSIRADSVNPGEDWEQFEVAPLEKDIVCDREQLFTYLDQLSAEGRRFKSLTYVVNQWNLGGVVRLKHHGCILTDDSGSRYLKFDFGRWGIGWSVLDQYPEHPKGTCLVKTFDIEGEPQRVKRYCSEMTPFAWTTNNCSTFSQGLMREVQASQPPIFDPWPRWSHCLATPPLQMPKKRPPPKPVANAEQHVEEDEDMDVSDESHPVAPPASTPALLWGRGITEAISRMGDGAETQIVNLLQADAWRLEEGEDTDTEEETTTISRPSFFNSWFSCCVSQTASIDNVICIEPIQ